MRCTKQESIIKASNANGASNTADASVRKIGLLGNHAPRRCGIATFTTDLADALTSEVPNVDCFVLAMNDAGKHHAYPGRVRFEIADNDLSAYRRAADFLNVNAVDIVCVQHEYGIFGGKAGGYLLSLLRELRMPIVTTLHTILAEPNPHQRRVMDELTKLSQRIVVMSARGAELLRSVHDVPLTKIDLIPHGIPNVPFNAGDKDLLGVAGKSVILTFGLLSPDKGIENVIDAMPKILERFPNTVYIVLGATHPHVKEQHGEAYRSMLEHRAQRLGVASSMIFHNRFVSQHELTEFLACADIYITPYLKAEQITSGTLAYAVGAGKAVISTPYWYAEELLADGRGILVAWRDPDAIAREVVDLLGNDAKRQALCARAIEHGQSMHWPAVARRYVQTFMQAKREHTDRLRNVFQAKTLASRPSELPEVNLDHIRMMTDSTGILQHASFNVPRYEDGYCLDDNARALLLAALVEESGDAPPSVVRELASRYMAFVSHAFNRGTGRFRNFMSYSRQWTEECGSEDSHGRAVWALGSVVGRSRDPGRQTLASQLFHDSLPVVSAFTSPRAWAFTLLGIHEYLRAFDGDMSVQELRMTMASKLMSILQQTATQEWPWFEDHLTYCNARLAQALLVSGSAMRDEEMLARAMQSLEWLWTVQCMDTYFSPVGSNGFYRRGQAKADFDQQPVEACAMIAASMDAYRVSGDRIWLERARAAFNWFLGQNHLQKPLYDDASGACRDGLHADRVNENRGAESTLSFLLSLLDMRSADRLTNSIPPPRELTQ